jgi:23S rRNA pseudouridine1911/1915/1917 synthase
MSLNRGCSYREQLGPDASGHTVLSYLATVHCHSTVDDWSARLARGEVELDEVRAYGDEGVRPGQVVVWHRPPWNEPDVPLEFAVLHEDDHVFAVHKPSGLPTMPAGGFQDHTLLTLVRERHPHAHPVHRLGRFTSGLVLFALTVDAASALGRAWRDHRVTKRYRTLGEGRPAWHALEITTPIGPVAHPRLGTVHAASAHGKPAHSRARVVERREGQTLFDVHITTGRPHQIRIHLAFAGHPLLGDPLYVAGGVPRAVNPALPGDGGYLLHAHLLELAHPATGRSLVVVAPLPPELEAGRG